MKNTRVPVVDDSTTVRMRIVEVIGATVRLEVVGHTDNGRSAIELCQKLRRDLITLDVMLPLMSGLPVTELLMAYCPTPILIVSSSTLAQDEATSVVFGIPREAVLQGAAEQSHSLDGIGSALAAWVTPQATGRRI